MQIYFFENHYLKKGHPKVDGIVPARLGQRSNQATTSYVTLMLEEISEDFRGLVVLSCTNRLQDIDQGNL